jgi:hypothetical protein
MASPSSSLKHQNNEQRIKWKKDLSLYFGSDCHDGSQKGRLMDGWPTLYPKTAGLEKSSHSE